MTYTRRRFLSNSAVGAAALGLSGHALAGGTLTAARARRVRHAHDELRVGVVGIHSRGRAHIGGLHKLQGVRVVALCDADRAFLDREKAEFGKRNEEVATYVDYRKLLDADDIDIVAIATPNHQHALQAVWACQAGKDVYLEKPVSHNVWEGRQIVKAAEKYKRIVACGTQSRSNPGMREAMRFVQEGGLGRVKLARGLCYKRRGSIGKVSGPQKPPASCDYDLWCGPAPMEPLMRKKLHYDWHWVWPTGNGDLGNQGIHQMDMCRWALNQDALAPSVWSIGGRVGYDDDATTPNSMVTVFGYPEAPLVFEVRGLPRGTGQKDMDKFLGASIGVVIHCEGGWLSISNYAGGVAYDGSGAEVKRFQGGGNHFANFVEAVRSRKPDHLTASIEDGHLSSALCHMGNVSVLLGEAAPREEIRARAEWMPELSECFGRLCDHLERNDVDIATAEQLTLGMPLAMDPKTERFVGNEAACKLLTRDYRAPFVVPETV